MNIRTLMVAGSAIAAIALAGCDRQRNDPVSTAPAPSAPVSTAPASPAGAPADRTAGQVMDDAGITAKVKAALLAEKGVNGTDINVDTAQGTVTLSGKVPDQSQVERATQVTQSVDGVKSVANKLTAGAS